MKEEASGLLKGQYITKIVQLYKSSKIRETETHRNGEIVKSRIKMVNPDILLLLVDRKRLLKISELEIKKTVNHLNQDDNERTLHLTNKDYMAFSNEHRTLTKLDHILGIEIILKFILRGKICRECSLTSEELN